ncbi:hypothetical protein HON52_01790 [Candidatus Uhrbacteria bacterium]|jgi:hypothetical protein|nr:hypothetical protein [Candidatus Uhrbacteria bacterium]
MNPGNGAEEHRGILMTIANVALHPLTTYREWVLRRMLTWYILDSAYESEEFCELFNHYMLEFPDQDPTSQLKISDDVYEFHRYNSDWQTHFHRLRNNQFGKFMRMYLHGHVLGAILLSMIAFYFLGILSGSYL